MPSREEIVDKLKHAQANIDVLNASLTGEVSVNRDLEIFAAQVEAMQCETCEHYDDEYFLCTIIGDSEGIVPADFGCFRHEPKENPAG